MLDYEVIGTDFEDVYSQYGNTEQLDDELIKHNEFIINEFKRLFPENKTAVFRFIDNGYDEQFFTYGTADFMDCIDRLAIKEGVNLVRFESGNYGIIGTYGSYTNGFEVIIPTEKQLAVLLATEDDEELQWDLSESEIIRRTLDASEKDLDGYLAKRTVCEAETTLKAFIFQNGKDDYTVYFHDLPEHALKEIESVLMRYNDSGYSARGTKADIIEEIQTM